MTQSNVSVSRQAGLQEILNDIENGVFQLDNEFFLGGARDPDDLSHTTFCVASYKTYLCWKEKDTDVPLIDPNYKAEGFFSGLESQ